MEKYRIEHETVDYCETVDNMDCYEPGDAEIIARFWAFNDSKIGEGHTFRIVDNETDEELEAFEF